MSSVGILPGPPDLALAVHPPEQAIGSLSDQRGRAPNSRSGKSMVDGLGSQAFGFIPAAGAAMQERFVCWRWTSEGISE